MATDDADRAEDVVMIPIEQIRVPSAQTLFSAQCQGMLVACVPFG